MCDILIIMPNKDLSNIVNKLLQQHKGILASDESAKSLDKKLVALNLSPTQETRKQWREVIITTPNLGDFIGGIILSEETIVQKSQSGESFISILNSQDILPGVKLDEGLAPFENSPEENITKGLENLEKKLGSYYKLGARFTKWRALLVANNNLPTFEAIHENNRILAQYAKLVIEANMVPILEPELNMKGNQNIQKSFVVLCEIYKDLFSQLDEFGVNCSNLVLKTSMVVPGTLSGQQLNTKESGKLTSKLLLQQVPKNIGGVVFLSGGLTSQQSTEILNEVNCTATYPFPVTYSFLRGILQEGLECFAQDQTNTLKSQQKILKRLLLEQKVLKCEYEPNLEELSFEKLSNL